MMQESFRKSIEEILFQRGLLTADQLNTLKLEIAKNKVKPEEYLINNKWITEADLLAVKSEVYKIPIIDLADVKIPREVLLGISEDIAKRYFVIPFEVTEDSVKVAMRDPFDLRAVQFLQNKFGKRVDAYYALPSQLRFTIQEKYGQMIDTEVSDALEEVTSEGLINISENIKDIQEVQQQVTENSSVARIVNMILDYAVKSKASDIHIEPLEKKMRVRFRINGVLVTKLDDMPVKLAPSLISRIKILSKLKIDEKRIPQDGRMQIKVDDKEIDLRISTLPAAFGEKVVIRLLEKSGGIPDITESGLRGSGLKNYLSALSLSRGIILITGPTGSGKTRTLASSLAKVNTEEVNIITLEDPIEIRIPGVNQVQINVDAGLTFASGLRSILRQDPDIIMVGEIRDEETARLATQASLTGHLVFATLHTNSAAGALPRLLDMNIEPFLISSTIQLVVAQRLVRTICPYCREEYDAPAEIVKKIHLVLDGLKGFDLYSYPKRDSKISGPGEVGKDLLEDYIPSNAEISHSQNPEKDLKVKLYRGKGCNRCEGSGYSGRIGIYEVLQVSDKIATMIMEHRNASNIHKQAKEDGMIDMVQDGFLKALEGITTIEDVLRVSSG